MELRRQTPIIPTVIDSAVLSESPDVKTMLERVAAVPSKERLDSFRREVYTDIARIVEKGDPTTDELEKYHTDDYVKEFMQWALDHGHGAALRDYQQKENHRGAKVIMPADLRRKAESVRDGAQKFNWD